MAIGSLLHQGEEMVQDCWITKIRYAFSERWRILDISRYKATSLQKCSGMARIVKVSSGDHTVLPAIHAFILEWNEPYLSLFFPAKAGPHLPTLEQERTQEGG